MAQPEDPIYRITVQPMDALGDLLALRRRPVYHLDRALLLFLTASEFRALRETVRLNGVNLTLISDDPHRRDAQLFNLITVEWGNCDFDHDTAPTGAAQPRPPVDPALGPNRQRRHGRRRGRRESGGERTSIRQ